MPQRCPDCGKTLKKVSTQKSDCVCQTCKNYKTKTKNKHLPAIMASFREGKYAEVLKLFKQLKGQALTNTKIAIEVNQEKTGEDMVSIVAKIDLETRTKLLAHFESEAALIKDKDRKIHVLTDKDDTLFPHHHGGSDTSWPLKEFYPGVWELLHSVGNTGYVTVLSARPDIDFILPKFKAVQQFREKCLPTSVLSGAALDLLFTGLPGKIKQSWQRDKMDDWMDFAIQKRQNFLFYKSIFPEFKWCFFGDIGQGDLITGRFMLKFNSRQKKDIHFVAIKDVIDAKGKSICERKNMCAKKEEEKKEPLFFFKSYIELASQFYRAGLLSKNKLVLVLQEAEKSIFETALKLDISNEEAPHFKLLKDSLDEIDIQCYPEFDNQQSNQIRFNKLPSYKVYHKCKEKLKRVRIKDFSELGFLARLSLYSNRDQLDDTIKKLRELLKKE